MKEIESLKEYKDTMFKLINKSNIVLISSYNIKAGFYQNNFYPNLITDILNKISNNPIKNKIIVNIHMPKECKDCGSERRKNEYKKELYKHLSKWFDLEFFVNNSFFKCVLFPPNHVIFGNFGPLVGIWGDDNNCVYTKNSILFKHYLNKFKFVLKKSNRITPNKLAEFNIDHNGPF